MDPTSTPDVISRSRAHEAVGLALGGGGARGLAHILALEVFDELGFKPAVLSGTSIGALFGAAYAAGLSALEIRERATKILSNPAEMARRLFSGGPRDWMSLWTISPLSASLLNPRSVVEIVFPEAAEIAIPQLEVPFVAMATDFREQSPVPLATGRLDIAIAASMALPALFRAVEHDGRILVDGGLTDPLPYDQFGADAAISVAVDVTGRVGGKSSRTPSALETVLGSSQIMQNAIIREKLKSNRPTILIRPPVDSFRILEFYKIKSILKAAAPMKEELKRDLDAALSGVSERML